MGRGPRPAKDKAKPAVPRKSEKNEDSKVRDLERRLAEARDQQTATAEILGVISRSQTDVQPVFDAVAKNAAQLCGASNALVWQLDGDAVRLATIHWSNREVRDIGGQSLTMKVGDRILLNARAVIARAVAERRVIHLPDIAGASDEEYGDTKARAAAQGFRALLAVPLMHEGAAVGVIFIRRTQATPFADEYIALLRTFAAQAVIAIENVRLFNELAARNRDLTATSEILQVISRSPTDVQPVFEAIVDNAHRLFRSVGTVVLRYDGDFLSPAALRVSAETNEWVPRLFPMRPSLDSAVGRCVLTRAAVHLADYEAPDAPAGVRDVAKAGGWRSALAVPMFRDEQIIGAIFVSRATPGAFADREIALLQTFADQAVIAIENVRLFKEQRRGIAI